MDIIAMHDPTTAHAGFTLIELLIVLMIMAMTMATIMPAITLMQRKEDVYGTANIIRTVHSIQRSNAIQFGYAGAIYGYTILSTNDPNLNGLRPGVQAWVIPKGGARTSMTRADFGRQLPWFIPSNPATFPVIEFTGQQLPVRIGAAAGFSPLLTSTNLSGGDLHVGFVPRAGFASVASGAFPSPLPPLFATIGGEARTEFSLRSVRKGFRDERVMVIEKTGVLGSRAP